MFCLCLQWLSFNVDMNTVQTWMAANAGPDYCGNQANSQLELWFNNQPDQSYIDAINAYWSGLSNASPEATNYMPFATRLSDAASAKATNLASAKSKLEALGLTADEIAALAGN